MRTIDSGKLVSSICADLDELAEVDVSLLPDQCVRDELLGLVRAANQIAAQLATRAAYFDARDLASLDGYKDLKGFLHGHGRLATHAAKPILERGRLQRAMPQLAAAAAHGDVSPDHLRPILDLVKKLDLPTVARADEILAKVASTGTVRDVDTACRRIRDHVDPDGPPPPPDPDSDYKQRFLSLARRGNHIHVRGQLDLETGAAIITALDALMRPPTQSDQRTPGQRRCDALGELAHDALNRGTLPEINGERPHLGLLITPKALTSQPGKRLTMQERAEAFLAYLNNHEHNHRCGGGTNGGHANVRHATGDPPDAGGHNGAPSERASPAAAAANADAPWRPSPPEPEEAWLDWVGEIPVALAQRIACDAKVWRAILDPATSLPLDVGRAYRSAPHWMRKALHVRDRGCRFPECEVPAQWTDAHHLDHWINGGDTSVPLLILLCRFHHRLVHEGGWRIELDQHTGEVRVWRPDGRPFELGPSQPWTGPTTRRT